MTLYARPIAGVWYKTRSKSMVIPRHGFVTLLGLECRKGGELGAVCTENACLTGMIGAVGAAIVQILLPQLAVLFNFPRRFFTCRGLHIWNLTTCTVVTSGGTTNIAV